MLSLPPTVRIHLAADPIDLRKGFDGLAAATRTILRRDPCSGHLFIFMNARKNRAKILVFTPSGFWLLYKRLEHGTFHLPKPPTHGEHHIELDATELALMLEGIDLRDAHRRRRWAPDKAA